MNKQQKIDAIYEKIARKDLDFGCRIFHKVDDKKGFEGKIIISETKTFNSNFYGILVKNKSEVSWLQIREMEIIGHPVMIGDVIEFIEQKELDKIYNYIGITDEDIYKIIFSKTEMKQIFKKWKHKRKPIEDQSDFNEKNLIPNRDSMRA